MVCPRSRRASLTLEVVDVGDGELLPLGDLPLSDQRHLAGLGVLDVLQVWPKEEEEEEEEEDIKRGKTRMVRRTGSFLRTRDGSG